ncbi:hypothetical protein Back11_51420 [Paenibacillus baekrokdamisoli]|uniref:Uncharacterized protein n=1 Tax=Paenibacillus baekrokdamisoli TaxID=1712516 RepID=A0A3G9IY18_9BACL|nr:hypothetical protein Back11_51420 [Paenibacillus baekrokdamisoli]
MIRDIKRPLKGIFPRDFIGPFFVCTISEKNGASKEPDIIVICQVPAISQPGEYADAKHKGA